jgi:hypothetical protein
MVGTFKTMAVALGAVVTLLAPTAHANDTLWAAIGYSPTKGTAHAVWRYTSRDQADVDAVTQCNIHYRVSDCVLAAIGPCASLATDPDPNNNAPYSGGRGWTLAEADADAMSKALPGWTIEGHQCGGDPAISQAPGESNAATS